MGKSLVLGCGLMQNTDKEQLALHTNMNLKYLQKMLLAGKSVYILDDFEEAAVRLIYEDEVTKAYLKHKGRKEVSIPQSTKLCAKSFLQAKR